ncbi:cytochrome-c peroxidase [Candidatus Nitrosacidococcus tergens]|uniref:Cytochrome c551 peroxidase n=1 Tax=Candidatus Nitrosacidococcus tergens TaxID=553981 RepID=A0A7G1QAR9_9GAMM|nr:cytochrome-c peroxidase [Candidatus Nitrosacidococcus tergens]CAB1276535.1 Cytochrome c551 peroxidase [Candidatus Nitrosacidococcus tergens]
MKKRVLYLALAMSAVYSSTSFAEDTLMEQAQSQFKPIPNSPPALRNGKTITPEKIELGKWLYFDPRLSKSWLISCNTCHSIGLGGVDLEQTSIGHGWAKGPRNAPTVLNSVLNATQFWDGRAKDLAAQAQGPVQAGVEMNNTPARVERTLRSMPAYVESFKIAFPGENNPVNFDNMAKAIEAFEATLLTPNAPFDQYLKGDNSALTDNEKSGLKLFMDKGCSSCHNGANLGGDSYRIFGVAEKPSNKILPEKDKGRFNVTKKSEDEYAFRVSPLRNIALTPPYFHSGQVWDLKEAVDIMATTQLGIHLTDKENTSIVAFLKTLTGDQPKVEYPTLPPQTKGTPLPITN